MSVQGLIGLPSMVPEILGGSLPPPGPLNSKKSLDRIGLKASKSKRSEREAIKHPWRQQTQESS